MNETPETDALMDVWRVGKLLTVSAMLNHARKLERERDEARAQIRRLFEILETVEVSDSEREFHPTRITSCRVQHTIELGELLPRLRELAFGEIKK